MDIVPIQASSVPCERVFSSGKETMTARRNKISPELMESLQVLKYFLKKGEELSFTQGMKWEEEMAELEEDAAENVPEDVRSYIRTLADARAVA
jgi:hypothetical protein